MAEPLRKILARDLAKQLFPDNSFYEARAIRDGGSRGVSIDATSVTLGQEGVLPETVIDPSTFPLPATRREDIAVEYSTSLFATKPTIITDDEEVLTNFNKRQSVTQSHSSVLNTLIADYIAHEWAATGGAIFKTSGATSRTATASGATGNRKKATKEDIIRIAEWFDRSEIPVQDRYAVLPTDLYFDLIEIDEFISYDKRGLTDLVRMGIIGEIYGFRIFKRSHVVYYDLTDAANPVLRAIGSEGGANDSHAGIFWQMSTARYAKGSPVVYISSQRGEYLGSTVNAAVRSGARATYLDGKGVAILVQDIAL